MLTVAEAQMKTFEEVALRNFRKEMADHARAVAPRLCATLDAAQLDAAVQAVIARAMQHGFTNRGPARLFVEAMCLFGSGFDTDPLYRGLAEVLAGPDDQMTRAHHLHRLYLEHVDKVCGDDGANETQMLPRLAAYLRQPPPVDAHAPAGVLMSEMHRVYPEKADMAGIDALADLVDAGWAQAQRRGLASARACGLAVMLMFVLGHACLDDPLYPWIARSLQAEAPARDGRLAQEALVWVQRMLGSAALAEVAVHA